MHFVKAAALLSLALRGGGGGTLGSEIEFGTVLWYAYAGLSCFLVLFAGMMSGLTLGLMSLGLVELEILQRSGTPTEKKQAGRKPNPLSFFFLQKFSILAFFLNNIFVFWVMVWFLFLAVVIDSGMDVLGF